MTLIHIYDKETGKLMRSQEPAIDPLETQLHGEPVYAVYENSTELELPEYKEHEAPFFIDGAWVVKGQYKNIEVYNKDSKSFEYCGTEELGPNQVFIDDKEGIERFKQDYQKYIVNENNEIVENPQYPTLLKIRELDEALAKADSDYQDALNAPIVFPVTGKLYKAKWIDDGTYTKIITGAQAGIVQFPIMIWDATEKAENAVDMSQEVFGQLCLFLTMAQQQAFNARKALKSELLAEKEKYENQITE